MNSSLYQKKKKLKFLNFCQIQLHDTLILCLVFPLFIFQDAEIDGLLSFIFQDSTGQKVWICPTCKMPDDGSPMIGCDICDDWYHWSVYNLLQVL